MGTYFTLILFHDQLRSDPAKVGSLMEHFALAELPTQITRKPSLQQIREAFIAYRDDMEVEFDELTDDRLELVLCKRHPSKENWLLKHLELVVKQDDIEKGLIFFDKNYCPDPRILVKLAEDLGPIGLFNDSCETMGVIYGSHYVKEAMDIVNGTTGWIIETVATFAEAVALFITGYLESKDSNHQQCNLYFPPIGGVDIRRIGEMFMVRGCVAGPFYRHDPEHVRWERILLSALFQPVNQIGDGWYAEMDAVALLELISERFGQLPFADPNYYKINFEWSGIQITLRPIDEQSN